jgi:hypothetical protein
MGIEYTAALSRNINEIEKKALLESLTTSPGWELLSKKGDTLAFKQADSPLQEQWPEDLQVEIEANSIYIVFHFGAKVKRESFITKLEKELNIIGITCEVEEL